MIDAPSAVRAAVDRTLDAAVLAFESTYEVLGPPRFRGGGTGCCDLTVPVVRSEVTFDPGEMPGPSTSQPFVLHGRTLWMRLPGAEWEPVPVRGLAASDLVPLLWLRGTTSAAERPGEPGRYDVEADVATAAANSGPDLAASLREDALADPPVDRLRGSVLVGDGGAGIVREVDLVLLGETTQRMTLRLERTERCDVEVPVAPAADVTGFTPPARVVPPPPPP
ncbi:hypothetical protein [Kineococcus sp. G2]|uniref:hypothetical protein n=1 Tax=Kineococcus sp. G2 TaxID=3127484 RepID=UPI00301C00F6